jgi:hypothetical protein
MAAFCCHLPLLLLLLLLLMLPCCWLRAGMSQLED